MKTLVILCAPCGVGKSTIREMIAERNQLKDFACIDTDAVGLNWHSYKGTDHENQYYTDTLKRADEISGDKNIFFVSAGMNPPNFYNLVDLSESIDQTFFIGMTCSDEEITKRLKARPAERKTDSDEFIKTQHEYSAWFKKSRGKFQLFIDNTNQTVVETAQIIENFIKNIDNVI